MKSLYPTATERRQISTTDVALQSEMTEMEELYWFALALTGNPEFAAKLVADTEKLPSTGRGTFHN